MPGPPLISVVMPTFNDTPFLEEAIESVLNQTLTDFEFIIVNDGSTDNTEAIIQKYLQADPRIIYLKHDHNLGNTVARNTGNVAAHGKYIALMDSDDVLASDRLQIQWKYLKNHPEIDVLGGAIVFFYPDRWHFKYYPTQPEYIRSRLFFLNCMGQPVVMARREVFLKYSYSAEKENMEDYYLWWSMAMGGLKIANLPQVMLYYRQSDSQLSHPQHTANREKMLVDFFKERLRVLAVEIPESDFFMIHHFIRGRIDVDKKTYMTIRNFLNLVEDKNLQLKIFKPEYFRAVLFFQRLKLIKYAFLEHGRRALFITHFLLLIRRTGPRSILLFWRNEGRYFSVSGEGNMHFEPLQFK
jgi:glycosyltransferase involved in cell wall biosynthesis